MPPAPFTRFPIVRGAINCANIPICAYLSENDLKCVSLHRSFEHSFTFILFLLFLKKKSAANFIENSIALVRTTV